MPLIKIWVYFLGILFDVWRLCKVRETYRTTERKSKKYDTISLSLSALLSFLSCRVAAFVKLQWDLALAGKMLRYRRGPVSTCPPFDMQDVYQTVSCCLNFGCLLIISHSWNRELADYFLRRQLLRHQTNTPPFSASPPQSHIPKHDVQDQGPDHWRRRRRHNGRLRPRNRR
jgi:hypothetical protein